MPPSMSGRAWLVIWMFRIAMNAPIIAAMTAIHTIGLARSGLTAAARFGIWFCAERVRAGMASPLDRIDSRRRGSLMGVVAERRHRIRDLRLGRDVGNDRHARAQ